MQPLGLYAPTMVVDGAIMRISDSVELNGFNLAHHTTALEQSVLGKRHLASTNGLALVNPTVCGKRSRSNSNASAYSSSAASSSHASVFSSSENDGSEYGSDSQTSIGDQTPSSRKSSMSETSSQQLEENLAAWRADLLAAASHEHCAKRIRDLQGEVVRLASEVVNTASQPCAAAAPAQPAQPAVAPIHNISPASSSSPSSSSSEGSTKIALVDCLVDAACRTLDVIWNASNPSPSCELAKGRNALPLQVFVRETLRRGRTSCSTLQSALLYCVRLGEATKHLSPAATSSMNKEELSLIQCPRRMFLASVMVASKFVQDRTYSNRAWSKISGLPLKDLGKLERAFLKAIDYRLMVSEGEWEKWTADLKRVAGESKVEGRRSSLSRSQSDNVTGAAVALDTELRAVSPRLASQVQPKYRHLSPELALPFPRAHAPAAGASAEN